jgi:hypothetical protein
MGGLLIERHPALPPFCDGLIRKPHAYQTASSSGPIIWSPHWMGARLDAAALQAGTPTPAARMKSGF